MRTIPTLAALVLAVAVSGAAQEPDSTKPAEKPTTSTAAPVQKATPSSATGMSAEVAVCSAVVDREPNGAGDTFSADVGELCLWSKITGAEGETTVTHVWSFNGQEMASVELPVRSASWRTWSRKTIDPSWVGDWEVKVLDASGSVIGSTAFKTAKAAEAKGN